MATHKLSFEDFESEDYSLIAIYTTLEDYRLAFHINAICKLLLKRNQEDLSFSKNEAHSLFDYEDYQSGVYYALLKNKSEIIDLNKGDELFHIQKVGYILPEFNKADFFLKIEPKNDVLCNQLLKDFSGIEKVTTARVINNQKIKNTNNLIF